ncbi:hypothetical protein PIB30_031661 [Stylosanthes scabra]|uniref:Uncharacterized protein n=1 Tax=Stylosanthes scabra TaxID=79078 RepID=A0ABU6YAY0_9FABA|nr:hypothetical protein [Stylosanthes scabra]
MANIFGRTEFEGASASQISTLTSFTSTISSLESKNSLRRKRDWMSLLRSYSLDVRMLSNPNDEMRLLLKLEGLLPEKILPVAENGERSWPWSRSRFDDAYFDCIPEAILNLAVIFLSTNSSKH